MANDNIRQALEALIAVLDDCPRHEVGAGGMTIDAQIRRTFINRVPAMAVETAREALDGTLDIVTEPK
jgi:hypothetical protein